MNNNIYYDLYMRLQSSSMKNAQKTGWLVGYILSEMLYDDKITSSKFNNAYNTLVKAYSFTDQQIDESDMVRIMTRAKELGVNALLGDSFLVIMAVIISAMLNQSSYDTNIVLLILSIYLTPYFIYMKD